MRIKVLRGVLTSLGPASAGSIVDLPANEALMNISNNKAEPATDPDPEPLVCEAPPAAPPVEVKRSTRQSRPTKE
jgi:hypothetical protein